MYVVANNKISLTFDVSMGGLALVRISDVMLQRDYLDKPSTLFEFAVNNGIPQDSYNKFIRVIGMPRSTFTRLRIDHDGVFRKYRHGFATLEQSIARSRAEQEVFISPQRDCPILLP